MKTAVVLASVVIGALFPVVTANAKGMPSCGRLRGRRLVTSRTLKVVEQGDERFGRVYACVPPRGRVRLVGTAHDETGASLYSVSVIATVGMWMALDFHNQVDPQISEDVDKAFDAGNGRSYRFFEEGIPEGPALEGTGAGVELARTVLNRYGQLGLALVDAHRCRIVGVEPSGRRRLLDSGPPTQIPPGSLTLHGHTVGWTDAGVERSATL